MVFEYILKENGIDPEKDLTIIQNIDFGSTAPALRMAAEILRLNLSPERLLLNPKEKVMLLHRLAKTAAMFLTPHSAPKKLSERNPDVIQRFTNALQKGMDYVRSHSPSETASVIKPQFPETTLEMITTIVTRYYEQDTWKSNLILKKAALICFRIS